MLFTANIIFKEFAMGRTAYSNVQASQASSAPWWLFGLLVVIALAAVVISWMMRQKQEAASETAPAAPPPPEPVAMRSVTVAVASEPEPAVEIAAAAADAAPVEEAAEEAAVPESPAEPDNLTRIEGIGPKISSWLNDAGITTFARLAEMEPEQIAEILQNAGHRIANPATWPEQAKLAAAGDWDTLAALQDNLHGGRRLAD